MQLSVGESERMARVLVVMRERVVALRHVEAQDAEAHGPHQLLLEGSLLLVRDRVPTYYSKHNQYEGR